MVAVDARIVPPLFKACVPYDDTRDGYRCLSGDTFGGISYGGARGARRRRYNPAFRIPL
jgi:hypothetical protein